MKCESLRNRLLSLPDPAAVPDALAGHLDACAACQAWHQLLVRVEAGIVATGPASRSGRLKRPLISRFRSPAESATADVVVPAAAIASRSLYDKLARLWPAGLVAAALLVGVLVWASLRNKSDGGTVAALPPDPFLDRVVTAKVKLDTAPDAAGRLAALDSLERGLHQEATTLSKVSPGAEMESLARMYEKVVADAMVEQARLLPADERRTVLRPYVDRLNEAAQHAHRLATEAPTGSDRPLLDIEKAALKGRTTLAQMMQGQG